MWSIYSRIYIQFILSSSNIHPTFEFQASIDGIPIASERRDQNDRNDIAAVTSNANELVDMYGDVRRFKPKRYSVNMGKRFQLAPRQSQNAAKTPRQSNRKATPTNRFNYGIVACSICGRSFFCEAMATKYYDGVVACSFSCATKSQ